MVNGYLDKEMKNINIVKFIMVVLGVALLSKGFDHYFPQVDFFYLLFIFMVTVIGGEAIRQKLINKGNK